VADKKIEKWRRFSSKAYSKYFSDILTRADLSNVVLKAADLRSTDLSGAKLNNEDLSGVGLRCSNPQNATFTDADLTGADLRKANLFGWRRSLICLLEWN
jgi:uncharacterized protein YjbI with pentapeptide repeats